MFRAKTLRRGTVSVCLAWSSPLPRYCCCVDCLCCGLDVLYFTVAHLKLETGDQRNLKYGVYRIIGSGAPVQSVSPCLLVVKRAIPLFHDGKKKRQRWNHLVFVSSTKEERDLCGSRLLSTFDPEGDRFRCVRDNLTRFVSRLVPSQLRKLFDCCCWLSSDSILIDEIIVKP